MKSQLSDALLIFIMYLSATMVAFVLFVAWIALPFEVKAMAIMFTTASACLYLVLGEFQRSREEIDHRVLFANRIAENFRIIAAE